MGLLWLGILGSGVAFVMAYYLIHEIGPTRTTMVTYLFPVGGVILGVVFLQEQLTWQLVTGSLLVLVSLLIANWEPKRMVRQERTNGTEPLSSASCEGLPGD